MRLPFAIVLCLLSTQPVHASPEAVHGLVATATSYSKIGLTWTAVPDAFSYHIYRAATGDFAPDESNRVMSTAATAYQDLGLEPHSDYHYRVAAVDETGIEGEASSSVSATTPAYSANIHPRLIMFPGDIADIRQRCRNEDPWKSWYAVVREAADRSYDEIPSEDMFNARIDQFTLFSTTWLVDGTDRYFYKLREALLDCPTTAEGENELSIGSTLGRLCYAYDIAYVDLSDDERRNVEGVIAYWGEWLSARVDQHYSNWRIVAASGLLAAGLLLDEPRWVEQSVHAMDYTLSDQIVGKGSNVEGCGYGGYLLGAAGHIMMMLKNAGVRDYFKDPRLMDVVRRRIQERLPWYTGNGYEDSPYYPSHDPFATAMLYSPMPAEARQMKSIFNKTSRACTVRYNRSEPEYLLYCYYTDSVPEGPILFSDWADPAAGIGYMGTGMGGEDFVISFNAKPYAITYANGHQRPDDLSFELAAYGAFLAHEPGYAGYAIEPYASYAHSGESHSTFTIAGESQDISIENTGLRSFLFSDVLSFMEGVSDNAYSKGSVSRSLVFVKPDHDHRGYVLLGDDVDLQHENDEFTWYLHGGLSDNLTIDGRDALWRVPRWITSNPGNNTVHVLAHMATPPTATFDERRLMVDGEDHYEFYSYVGYRSDRQHTKYIASSFNGSQDLLTVVYPWKEAGVPPTIEDIERGVLIETNDVASIQEANDTMVAAGVTHDARLMVLRKDGMNARFFFAKDGTSLRYNNFGFRSTRMVQLIYDGCSSNTKLDVHVLADTSGTALTVHHPAIGPAAIVSSDGDCTPLATEAGASTILLHGAGQHRLRIQFNKETLSEEGSSQRPEMLVATAAAAPAAPSELTVRRHTDLSNDEDYLILDWQGSFGAEYYVVKQVLNAEHTAFKTVATSVHHPSEAFLPVDPEAEFVVTAVNSAGESPNSNPACLTTPAYPGLQPQKQSIGTKRAWTQTITAATPSERPKYGPYTFYRLSNGHDTYVTDGADAAIRHGTEGHLIVRSSQVEGGNARALIRFQLGSGRIREAGIGKAVLRIHCTALEQEATIQLLGVADDSWKETLATWNGAPPSGDVLCEQFVEQQDKACAFDVTEFVRTEYQGDKTVSFMLVSAGEGSFQFGAKEGDRGPTDLPHKRPVLEVTGHDGDPR